MQIVKDIAREVAANLAMSVAPVRRWRINRPRAGAEFSPEMLERYAFQALRGLERHRVEVAGLTVAEFGPGDTLASGLALLAAGAESYTTLDRFTPDYSRPGAKAWYRGVRAAWSQAFPGRAWPAWLDPELFPAAYPRRVRVLNVAVEEAQEGERYDIVCSWQVGEHVEDIQAFADVTAAMLKPTGVAVHRVDFGPHGCWERYEDPLTFLRFPRWAWHAMGASRGVPNRHRHHEFMQAWEAAGLVVECREPTWFSPKRIRFDRLHATFRGLPRESLLTRDVIYLCWPAAVAPREHRW